MTQLDLPFEEEPTPLLDRWWILLLETPGGDVLRYIAQLWPRRHNPEARGMLRLWVAGHRAQELSLDELTHALKGDAQANGSDGEGDPDEG